MRVIYYVIIIIGIFTAESGYAQRYMSDSTYVRFFSEAPLENIDAVTYESASAIDLSSGNVAFSVPIKSFQFDKSLMQEHFNENYLESDKYPKATFQGKMKDWDDEEGEKRITASGKMKIHGITQEISVEGTVIHSGDEIVIRAVFPVRLEDYEIDIPKAVFYNIAEVVEVTIFFSYKPL